MNKRIGACWTVASLAVVACSGGGDETSTVGVGGAAPNATGGASIPTGGSPTTGGSSSTGAAGGTTGATGGSGLPSGGLSPTGGASGGIASGGTAAVGALATGGAIGGGPGETGGSEVGTGGSASGGLGETGGLTNTGGASTGGETTGGTATGGATLGGAPTGGSTTGGRPATEATILPDPSWACGVPDGVPPPAQGDLVFQATLELDSIHEAGPTQYGNRRLPEVSGDVSASMGWQLPPAAGAVSLDGACHRLENAGRSALLVAAGTQPAVLFNGDREPMGGWTSAHYGTIEPAPQLRHPVSSPSAAAVAFALLPETSGTAALEISAVPGGVRLSLALAHERWTVWVAEEGDMRVAEPAVRFSGQVLFLRETAAGPVEVRALAATELVVPALELDLRGDTAADVHRPAPGDGAGDPQPR